MTFTEEYYFVALQKKNELRTIHHGLRTHWFCRSNQAIYYTVKPSLSHSEWALEHMSCLGRSWQVMKVMIVKVNVVFRPSTVPTCAPVSLSQMFPLTTFLTRGTNTEEFGTSIRQALRPVCIICGSLN